VATAEAHPELADLPQGWFHHGPQILSLIEQHRPQVVVELGTWLGASAIAIARSVRRWGGTITCVDTWAGELNEHAESPIGRTPLMILSCARSMVEAGVSASVRLIPASTLDAASCWTLPIDFLYIDAGHGYDSVRADLEAWVPCVKPGGVICGDDYGHPRYPGVKRAWDEYESERGLTLTRGEPIANGLQLIYGTV
jgi:predicted O-methyltransferase YrrM